MKTTDVGLFVLRIGVGGTLVAHGAQKLFGAFGGHGLAGTAAYFDSIGFRPGRRNALMAGLGEAGGGTLLALGLATPAAGAAVAGTMAVASTMHTSNGFFAQDGGFEFPAVLGWVGAALAVGGPGQMSLDAAMDHRLGRPWMRAVALAAVPLAVASVVRARREALAEAAVATSGDPANTTAAGDHTNPTAVGDQPAGAATA